ncbi:uncharacterized protein LOC108023318 [Drosophila biarmipes]|uniref:uncharacterized protein LOC108023318 n=1 Tax=Drosophila biarmipes TaxID=125945 RepID=UPI0007E6C656|nr:uncharacterized protein LOC108023318 [Drosophila biarmipes]
MANFIKTEDQVKISEIVEKLVKQNSKRYAKEEDNLSVPCSSRDVMLKCPELSGIQAVSDLDPLVPRAGSAHTYRTGQLLTIGRRVASRMVDPSGHREMLGNRCQLDERLRSAGIYHNRLGNPYGLAAELEEGGHGDTDPGKPTTSLGSMA